MLLERLREREEEGRKRERKGERRKSGLLVHKLWWHHVLYSREEDQSICYFK